MSLEIYRSYIQGIREASLSLGDPVPPGMEEGSNPSVSEHALDTVEYMRGQINAILAHLEKQRG